MKNLRNYIERLLSLEAKRPGSEQWVRIVSYKKKVVKMYLSQNNITLNPEDEKVIMELCETPYQNSIEYICFQIRQIVRRDKPFYY